MEVPGAIPHRIHDKLQLGLKKGRFKEGCPVLAAKNMKTNQKKHSPRY